MDSHRRIPRLRLSEPNGSRNNAGILPGSGRLRQLGFHPPDRRPCPTSSRLRSWFTPQSETAASATDDGELRAKGLGFSHWRHVNKHSCA